MAARSPDFGEMLMVFLERFFEALLLAHLFVTFVLVGSLTHNMLIVIKYVRGKFGRKQLERYYTGVAFWSYVIVYILGALIYPAYHVYIRGKYFDADVPWATGLFEIKEHWSALALAMFLVYYCLRKTFEPDDEKGKLWFYVPLCLILNVIVWYQTVVGCYLSLLKGSF